jgi:F-type H+-transporting ATPase subunit delta
MAETATIARPYAEAIFAMADKAGTLGQWSETLAHLAAVAQAPEMRQILGNPKVTPEQFVDLFSTAQAGLPAEARAFLQMLVENRRLEALPLVRDQFEQLKAEREGAVDASIETAFPFQAGELEGLVADLERRFKRKIRPQVSLNKDLIGGARVSVGDKVIDGTVRGKLDAMNAGLMGS